MLLLSIFFFSASALANQVFYRIGSAKIGNDRSGQIFADAGGAGGVNDGDSGLSISAGLDLKLFDCPLFENNELIGEIYVNYVKFSEEKVVNAIDFVVAGDTTAKEVNVSELSVVIAPKYKMNFGKFKPWLVPMGLAFLVNAPPSNTTNYLDIGYHVGLGAEYQLVEQLSLGLDLRYTKGAGDPSYKFESTDFGFYVGINF